MPTQVHLELRIRRLVRSAGLLKSLRFLAKKFLAATICLFVRNSHCINIVKSPKTPKLSILYVITAKMSPTVGNDYVAAMEKLDDYHKMTVPDRRSIGLYDTLLGLLVGGNNPRQSEDALRIFELCRDANFLLEAPTVNRFLQCVSSEEDQTSVIEQSLNQGLSLGLSKQGDSLDVSEYLVLTVLVRSSIRYAFTLWENSGQTSAFTLHGISLSQFEELGVSERFRCVEQNGSLAMSVCANVMEH